MAENSRLSIYFLPEQIQDFFFEHTFNSYFASLWDTVTRKSLNHVGANKAELGAQHIVRPQ